MLRLDSADVTLHEMFVTCNWQERSEYCLIDCPYHTNAMPQCSIICLFYITYCHAIRLMYVSIYCRIHKQPLLICGLLRPESCLAALRKSWYYKKYTRCILIISRSFTSSLSGPWDNNLLGKMGHFPFSRTPLQWSPAYSGRTS